MSYSTVVKIVCLLLRLISVTTLADACWRSKESSLVQRTSHVLHIGIDGLKPSCMGDAPGGAPNMLKRMRSSGSSTLTKARTVIQTVSAPAWTSMLCGMKTEETGVVNNEWLPPWIGNKANITPVTGDEVPFPCVFGELKRLEPDTHTGLFYDWDFIQYLGNAGHPNTLDKDLYVEAVDKNYRQTAEYIIGNATNYLREVLMPDERSYTFVYLVDVDERGHLSNWCSEEYLEAVKIVDEHVGTLLNLIEELKMTDEVLVMLSSDHGGHGNDHGSMADSDLFVPIFLMGPGIKKGHEIEQDVNIIDMVPTAFHLMGLQTNKHWTGRVIEDAID